MARAYSMDLRERVAAAVANDQSCRQVSTLFRVSVASVVTWALRFEILAEGKTLPTERVERVEDMRLPRYEAGFHPGPRSPFLA